MIFEVKLKPYSWSRLSSSRQEAITWFPSENPIKETVWCWNMNHEASTQANNFPDYSAFITHCQNVLSSTSADPTKPTTAPPNKTPKVNGNIKENVIAPIVAP